MWFQYRDKSSVLFTGTFSASQIKGIMNKYRFVYCSISHMTVVSSLSCTTPRHVYRGVPEYRSSPTRHSPYVKNIHLTCYTSTRTVTELQCTSASVEVTSRHRQPNWGVTSSTQPPVCVSLSKVCVCVSGQYRWFTHTGSVGVFYSCRVVQVVPSED